MNPQRSVIVVCPSLGKACGVGEYSSHAITALSEAGWHARGVRTIREAESEIVEQNVHALIVQHEYGLWQEGAGPHGLGEGESTEELVLGLGRIHEHHSDVRIGIICHTVLGGYREETTRLIRSGFPLLALHREGARLLGGKFMEHGAYSVKGFMATASTAAANPLTIGAFGMFTANKGIRSAAELARRLRAKLVVCSFCADDAGRQALREIVSDLDASVDHTFLTDREVLTRLSACDILYLPQWEGQIRGQRPRVYSSSGSVRLMLNLRRPIIVNRFWGYDELLDVLSVAESVDEAATQVLEMVRHPELYRACVDRIDRFAAASRLDDQVVKMVTDLVTSPPLRIPAVPQDELPQVTRANVRRLTDEFIETIRPYPGGCSGRGIVICAGGIRYNVCAWVLIKMLRGLGCRLPIQVWRCGHDERDEEWIELVSDLGVECVDADEVRMRHPHPRLAGWALKPYAMLHCPFREVLLLDADNVPTVDPTYLFDSAEYLKAGALFWPDGGSTEPTSERWEIFGVPWRDELEQESGQVLVNKETCWRELSLCDWYNQNSDFFYNVVYGDKDTFRFAWHRLGKAFAMPSRGIEFLPHTLCQHDCDGRRVFQHRCHDKWSFSGNRRIPGFLHEERCFELVQELRDTWWPLRSLVPALTEQDRDRMRAMAEAHYQFERLGHSRWPIHLSENGLITEGWNRDAYFWWAQDEEVLLAGSDGRISYRLTQEPDGRWRGRSLREQRIAVRLTPRSAPRRIDGDSSDGAETKSATVSSRKSELRPLPKIFCITLRQTPGRTEAARQHFQALGLDVEFFYGIHGRTFGVKTCQPTTEDSNHFMSQGCLGILLSHYMLWTMLAHLPYEEVLVLEDDAYFRADFHEQFSASYADLPPDWDLVFVGSCCTDGKPTRRISPRIVQVRFPLCGHALLLRKRALRVLLQTNHVARDPIDIQIERLSLPKLNHYCFMPPLAGQRTLEGTWMGSVHDLTYDGIEGPTGFEDVFRAEIARCAGGVFVEVGSRMGRTSAFMAEQIKLSGKPIAFYCIDPFEGGDHARRHQRQAVGGLGSAFEKFRENMARCGVFDQVQLIVGDSANSAAQFDDGSIDFVFLAATESGEVARREIAAWLPKVKPNGTIAGHGCSNDGVATAVRERFPDAAIQGQSWVVRVVQQAAQAESRIASGLR